MYTIHVYLYCFHYSQGTLHNGNEVAVKKLLVESIHGKEQFISEVTTISEVRQRNLVELKGCCYEGSKRLLVYEYFEHGSLDTALHGQYIKIHSCIFSIF